MSQDPEHGCSPSPEPIILNYLCSDWRMSSQRAADLYSSGTKLWTREDLKDIEHQLSQSYTMKTFSVRRIDGSTVQLLNPMFQVQNPIWYETIRSILGQSDNLTQRNGSLMLSLGKPSSNIRSIGNLYI